MRGFLKRAKLKPPGSLRFVPFGYFISRSQFKELVTCKVIALLETSLLTVSDTEILQLDWTFPAPDEQDSVPAYAVKAIGEVNNDFCYQCAAVSDDNQLLAVATSKDSILLLNIQQATQLTEFIGHTQ